MLELRILSCLICLHGLIGTIHGADKYTDENRPYEFGFTIDGEQHRHEKKDENGIIMGEFGFITADGVYHVTVYATDENGKFKILSMKNIRVKPYPTASTGVKKGHSIPFLPSANAPVVQRPSTSKNLSPQQDQKQLQINKQISSPAKSCSHCSLPTTTTKAPPPQLTDIATVAKDRSLPGTSQIITSNNYQQNTPLSSSSGQSSYGKQENHIGKSDISSYSTQQANPSTSGFGQNNPKYLQGNPQQNSFGNVQEDYQQKDLHGNPNYPQSMPNLDYPQQNSNENPNIPQTNQYYPPNGDDFGKNTRVGNDGSQNYPPNRNSGIRYYSQEDGNVHDQGNDQQKEIGAVQNYPQEQPNYAQSGPSFDQSSPGQQSLQTPKDTIRNPKQYNAILSSNVGTGQSQGFRAALASQVNQPISNKPALLAAQMQIVPKDTNIHYREPGEEEGLPDGLSKDDMTQLLYTFNYTVGFHGHHEEGYSNGAKKGYYYVTGRNGIRTRIDYVADEKGFRPKISQEVLELLSDDVPKPETEKDEKYGLKGYEFKWIYYPKNE